MAVLTPGTLLGGCRIDAVVGRGGMGVVYRARQIELDRDVAVKVIAPELVEDPQSRRRFLSEARAAGAVEHPNVVPVHGVGVADECAYLLMRYVAGDDLRTLVRRDGPLSPTRAGEVAQQLGGGLDAIHRAGYVHRDVKPQNVLIDASGHVYLSDFGLAKQALATAGPTSSEHWVGTLDYVAPEQIRGEPVDARADVYALGGVVYFMLTGRVPFEREGDHAKLWAHLVDPPPLPSAARPELPAALDAVVRRAMAKDPAQRHPSAGDLGRDAVDTASGGGTARTERMVARGAAAASTVESRKRVPPPRKGRRARPAYAAAVLMAVAAVAAFILLDGGDRPGGRAANQAPTPQPTAAPPSEKTPAAGSARVGKKFAHVGDRPRDVEVVNGHPWVVSSNQDRITSLDAGSGDPRAHQPFVGKGAADIARDGDMVWVAGRGRRGVLGFSARGGSAIRYIETSLPPIRVAAGPSGLWVVGREEPGGPAVLMRYNRDGRGPLQWEKPYPSGISALAFGGGYLWVALERENRVVKIPRDGAPEHGAWLGAPATALAYGAGYAWATVEEDDSIARINPRNENAPTKLAGREPKQLAVADQRVFVASYADHTVVVIDAKTLKRIDKLRVSRNPYAVAAGGGHVWVTGISTDTLTRIDLGT